MKKGENIKEKSDEIERVREFEKVEAKRPSERKQRHIEGERERERESIESIETWRE